MISFNPLPNGKKDSTGANLNVAIWKGEHYLEKQPRGPRYLWRSCRDLQLMWENLLTTSSCKLHKSGIEGRWAGRRLCSDQTIQGGKNLSTAPNTGYQCWKLGGGSISLWRYFSSAETVKLVRVEKMALVKKTGQSYKKTCWLPNMLPSSGKFEWVRSSIFIYDINLDKISALNQTENLQQILKIIFQGSIWVYYTARAILNRKLGKCSDQNQLHSPRLCTNKEHDFSSTLF